MKDSEIKSFLKSEDGKRNAERFIKALKEKRLLCSVAKVGSQGMSRTIKFREIAISKEGDVCILQFDWFFSQIGFRYSNDKNGISVRGCGMDMIFSTIYNVWAILKVNGFDVPEDYSICEDYHSI